jgi:hypothetical protein
MIGRVSGAAPTLCAFGPGAENADAWRRGRGHPLFEVSVGEDVLTAQPNGVMPQSGSLIS